MYETQFSNGPMGFAQHNPMCPADFASDYDRDKSTETQLTGEFKGFRHTRVNREQRIAKLTMDWQMTGRGRVMSVKAALAGQGLPAYFLPWDPRGAVVELTIHDKDPNLKPTEHPRFFFTAALSGCTVFFRGNAQKPTIYHCGTAGGGAGTGTTGDSNEFFRLILRECRHQGIGAYRHGGKTMVGTSDYMNSSRSGMSDDLRDLNDEMLDHLRTRYGNKVLVETTNPWGMVFGVRQGHDWTFYLQRNCSIAYKTWEDYEHEIETRRKIWHGLRTKTTTHKVTGRRRTGIQIRVVVMAVTQIFPGGGGQTFNVTDSVRFNI